MLAMCVIEAGLILLYAIVADFSGAKTSFYDCSKRYEVV